MTTYRSIRLLLSLPILAAALLVATPGVALASCMMPAPIENVAATADIVFVGTVSATSNGNRWAEVAVQEIWRGPAIPATVVVQGGPGGDGITSIDRSFEVGKTYLFFPMLDAGTGVFSDNSCTSTTEFTDELEKLRPADAHPPASVAATDTGFDVASLLPVGVALALFAVLLVVGLLARGRQET